MNPRVSFPAAPRRAAAFSLVEIMVVVALLTVIVLGLYSVFDQTQRALRGNTTQVDVMEAGRAALDLIGRDLEEANAAWLPGGTNLFASLTFPNARQWQIVPQALGTNDLRTNLQQQLFFLVRSNNYWVGKGYFVAPATNPAVLVTNGVGTLYRFTAVTPATAGLFYTNQLQELIRLFLLRTNASPVADGVIHFQARALDFFGSNLLYSVRNLDPRYATLYLDPAWRPLSFQPPLPQTNVILRGDPWLRSTEFYFLSNALPAHLELEMGFLEPQAWEKLKAMPAVAGNQYLQRQAGAVHLFVRRIPIRNSQP